MHAYFFQDEKGEAIDKSPSQELKHPKNDILVFLGNIHLLAIQYQIYSTLRSSLVDEMINEFPSTKTDTKRNHNDHKGH